MEVMDIINRTFKNKESDKWKMIYHAALTFDVSLDTLSSILNMEKKLLLNRLELQSDAIVGKVCLTDQNIAQMDFIHYFVRIFNAGVEKNKDLQKEIINQVVGIDKDMKGLMSVFTKGYEITLEDALVILRYQVKYSISTKKICNEYLIGLNRVKYTDLVNSLPDEYNKLKSDFNDLTNFYDLKFRQNYGYSKNFGLR